MSECPAPPAPRLPEGQADRPRNQDRQVSGAPVPNLRLPIVLVSVLVGVELFGLLGALLAIPAAGVIQVVAIDLYRDRGASAEPTEPDPDVAVA